MGIKLAIDFGTTNSLLARWDPVRQAGQVVAIPNLSNNFGAEPGLIPSLLYVRDGRAAEVLIGQSVLAADFPLEGLRLFRNFKRGISANGTSARILDGVPWSDFEAGKQFLDTLLAALPFQADEIEQLVLTVPVASFDGYSAWLRRALGNFAERVRIVDESTAAALGYAVTEPGAIVLVIDFGGGTLDLSLVRLPESREKTGQVLFTDRPKPAKSGLAQVIAKTGLALGGSDIDIWLGKLALEKAGLAPDEPGQALLAACEQAKIALSAQEETEIEFRAQDGQGYSVRLTRADFEALMEKRGFFSSLNGALEKVMGLAHQKDVYREDIGHILMVGGTSLIPSVQRSIDSYFRAVTGGRRRLTDMPAWPAQTWSVENTSIRADKPFTAVVEGALLVSAGLGLDDQLAHGFGLNILDEQANLSLEEIIPMGSKYPSSEPVTVHLSAAHPQQRQIGLEIGQINPDAADTVEVRYENGQPVFFAQATNALRLLARVIIPLDPPGEPGKARLAASFSVDAGRQLRLSVTDLQTRKKLIQDQPVEPETDPKSNRESLPALAEKAGSGFHISLAGLGGILSLLNPSQASIEALTAALRSSECMVRYTAAEMLSRRNDRESRLVFENVLKTGTAPQRASVIRHAYRFSWFSAAPLFRRGLADPDARVIEAAIFSLCKMRQPEAYQQVTEILRNGSDAMRMSAVWGLQNHPDGGAVPVLALAVRAASAEIRALALEVLGASDAPEAIPLVRAAMSDPDDNVKYAATLSLVELARESCFDEVAELIETSSGESLRWILRGFFHATNYLGLELGKDNSGRLFAALESALGDSLPAVRVSACMLLAWSRAPRAGEVLLRAFQTESDSQTRAQILTNAVHLSSPVAETLVQEALDSPDTLLHKTAEFLRT